jgi:hypothetical protein
MVRYATGNAYVDLPALRWHGQLVELADQRRAA